MPSEIISLTEFRTNASDWVKRVQSEPPVVLTQNGHGVAVVQSYASYHQMRLELALLGRVQRALADDAAGRTLSTEEVFRDVRARLKKKLKVAQPRG